MNKINITIEIDGDPVPATEVVWAMYGRCGCMNGVTSHNGHTQDPTDLILTADQAMEHFFEVKALRERAREDGQELRPLTWDQYRSDDFMGCHHEPKWGIPVAPVPEGMEWGTTDRWWTGRRTYRKHIIPVLEGDPRDRPWADEAKALCGKKARTAVWYSARDKDGSTTIRETVTCRKCEAAAAPVGDPS